MLGMIKHNEHFLKKFIINEESNCTLKIRKKFNISLLKTAMNNICNINEQLKVLNTQLQDKKISNQWSEKVEFCENLKYQVKVLLKSSLNHNKIYYFKKKLKQQNVVKNKKKERNKNRKLRIKYSNKRKNRLIIQIDNWIKEKQNEIDREKEKANLRKDADIVLSDIRTKRTDARKFLIILRELEDLRKAKVAIARVRGEIIPLEADKVFNNIIVKLTQHWATIDREYVLEEKGLKLMIKTDNEQQNSKYARNVFDDWEMALFRKKISMNHCVEGSLENFITLRMMWDRCINGTDGSEIPVGWVMPCASSSTAWTTCLSKKHFL